MIIIVTNGCKISWPVNDLVGFAVTLFERSSQQYGRPCSLTATKILFFLNCIQYKFKLNFTVRNVPRRYQNFEAPKKGRKINNGKPRMGTSRGQFLKNWKSGCFCKTRPKYRWLFRTRDRKNGTDPTDQNPYIYARHRNNRRSTKKRTIDCATQKMRQNI